MLREPVACIVRADLQFFGQFWVVLRWSETHKRIELKTKVNEICKKKIKTK